MWHCVHILLISCMAHYSDIIMSTMAAQITTLTIVYSTVYSGGDQRKYRSSARLAFFRGNHRWPVNSPHTKGQLRGKRFHLMTSSWYKGISELGDGRSIYRHISEIVIEIPFVWEQQCWSVIHSIISEFIWPWYIPALIIPNQVSMRNYCLIKSY